MTNDGRCGKRTKQHANLGEKRMNWVCVYLEKKVGENKIVEKVCFRPKEEIATEKIMESWRNLFPEKSSEV